MEINSFMTEAVNALRHERVKLADFRKQAKQTHKMLASFCSSNVNFEKM